MSSPNNLPTNCLPCSRENNNLGSRIGNNNTGKVQKKPSPRKTENAKMHALPYTVLGNNKNNRTPIMVPLVGRVFCFSPQTEVALTHAQTTMAAVFACLTALCNVYV